LNLGRLVWSLWALKIIVQSTELGGDRYLGELVTLFSLFPANETCEPGKLVPSGTMRSRRVHVLGTSSAYALGGAVLYPGIQVRRARLGVHRHGSRVLRPQGRL
jgi:hypothetical protein